MTDHSKAAAHYTELVAEAKAETRKHKFNDRLFCSECGADMIGLRGFGPKGMTCPFDKRTALAEARVEVDR